MTAAADGTATAVWLRANLAQTATTVDSGVTWSAPVNLTTTSFANKPQVAAAADGNDVTATWSHWNGSNYIVQSAATSDAGENWGTAVSLSAAGGSALGTQVASSSNGSAVTAVWYRSDGSNNIIQASTRTTPGPLTFTSGEFPAATVGVPAGLTVTVTNTGGGEVTPSAITAAGSGVSVTGGTCAVATPIAGWASCTVTLAWIPAATGPLAAGELTINYPEGANSADALALTGTATAAPTPTPSSTSSPPAPTVTPVPTPSSSPTSTPTATPTPMPPPTPTVRTTLTVGAKPASLRLPVGRPTKVVKKIVSNGKSTVSAKCLVNGQKINRACDIRLTPNRLRAYPSAANDVARVAVVVTPKCSLNVRVVVRVVAKKAGAARATWTRSWRVHNQPAIVCSTRGTG